jgi:osmotically-inducible protein OsmY
MRALLRLIIVVAVLAALAAYLLGYRVRDGRVIGPNGAVATTVSVPEVDTTKPREVAAAIGDRVVVGATAAQHALANTALTGKIKAKIALDDTLESANISVETADSVVTLTGTVISDAQHTRVLQLAHETEGVKSVADRIKVQK